MKKILALLLALGITLLFGCRDDNPKNQSSVSSQSNNISISLESNIFSLDFADLYQKISSQLGIKDKNSMALHGINADNAISFIFTPEGEIKDFEIGFCAKTPRADIAGEFRRTAYSISNHSAKDTPLSQIKKIYRADINKTNEIITSKEDIRDYSDFWTQMKFLHQLDLKKILKQYSVGNPTVFFLRFEPITDNCVNNLKSNVICLDCTDPSKLKQMDRITFSKKSPYAHYFPGIKYYYAIIPYYESELSVDKMWEMYYDNAAFNNIILLLIRE